MNNGQMSIVSLLAVMPLVTQNPGDAATGGAQQNSGSFAGLLSGIQLMGAGTELPDSGHTEPSMPGAGKHVQSVVAAAAIPAVDMPVCLIDAVNPATELPVRMDAAQQSPPAAEHAAPESERREVADTRAEGVPPISVLPDGASQMALAAYLQPGRMPDVNIPTQLPVDTQQNAATIAEQHDSPPVSPAAEGTEQRSGQRLTAASEKSPEETAPAVRASIPKELQLSEGDRTLTAGRQTVSDGEVQAPLPRGVQAVPPDRTSGVNTPAPPRVEKLQNAAIPAVPAQPVLFPAAADKVLATQSMAEPVQMVQMVQVQPAAPRSVTPVPDSAPDMQADLQDSSSTGLSGEAQSEKTAEKLHEKPATPDMLQPKPPAALLEGTPVPPGSRSAALVQETHGNRQRLAPEVQLEKGKIGNESHGSTEKESQLQLSDSATEAAVPVSDASFGSDSTLARHDDASDSQMLAQDLRGQMKTEHQRAAAFSGKPTPAEPLRQESPEQVMQQVKDRLAQHDVKPGNQQITLTLSPDSLGELKMNLNLQGQKLSVEIVAENRMVRDAIAQHTDTLKESLARQNITMESFDVTTGGKGSAGQGQNQGAWREMAKQQQQQQFWTSPRSYQTARADFPSAEAAYQMRQGQSMLDIHY